MVIHQEAKISPLVLTLLKCQMNFIHLDVSLPLFSLLGFLLFFFPFDGSIFRWYFNSLLHTPLRVVQIYRMDPTGHKVMTAQCHEEIKLLSGGHQVLSFSLPPSFVLLPNGDDDDPPANNNDALEEEISFPLYLW
ncbi:hypothetical protein RIF29_14028 [Crotalaria pallida]|uniref:Uncharacterized protein n=1 Tax=Crotalaria pallida TaxID=3830 RepID=A0AAN9FGS0_CROPI